MSLPTSAPPSDAPTWVELVARAIAAVDRHRIDTVDEVWIKYREQAEVALRTISLLHNGAFQQLLAEGTLTQRWRMVGTYGTTALPIQGFGTMSPSAAHRAYGDAVRMLDPSEWTHEDVWLEQQPVLTGSWTVVLRGA